MFTLVNKKTWNEFREAGLLWWINTILHMFGWAIVFDFNDDKTIREVYPARVKFRGFGDEQVENGYKNVSRYLLDNIGELYKESIELKVNDEFNVKIDDYICGYEIIGDNQKRKMCGWVDKICEVTNGHRDFDIQCDDGFRGHRGNTIHGEFGVSIEKPKPRPKINM